jgi:hypothetical protein
LVSPHRDAPKLKWSKLNSKYQITNIKQITMTEIQKSKQCLGLEGLVTCREPLGRTIEYWNLKFICNLPARRLFGGVLGICDFRHKTPKADKSSLRYDMLRVMYSLLQFKIVDQ